MHTNDKSPQLLRGIGPTMAIAMVVGNVIGSGIFLKPGNIAAASGNFGLILSVWIAGGVLCILGAMCFAELATMFPQAGGIYVYLKHAYGKCVAFLFGWTEFLLLRPASIGALSVAFVGSFTIAVGWQASDTTRWLLSSVLILFMTWINILGVVWGGRMQVATTLVKVGFLLLVSLSPLLCIPFRGWTIDASNFATVAPIGATSSLTSQIAMILLAVMWAYDGWHGITPLAEEVQEPQRNIPLALFGGIGVLIALYLAATFAYHSVLSMTEMQLAGDHAAERMLERLAGRTGLAAMSAVIMCSTFGAINSNILMAPRIPFAMGRDRLFFPPLGHVHAKYRTPVAAILTTSMMAIGLIGLITLGKSLVHGVPMTPEPMTSGFLAKVQHSLRSNTAFGLLTNCFTFAASAFYALAVVAVIVLRKRNPTQPRPYRTWGYPVVPVVFVSVYAWFLLQIYVSNPAESRVGILFILSGLPTYFAFRWWNGTNQAHQVIDS